MTPKDQNSDPLGINAAIFSKKGPPIPSKNILALYSLTIVLILS